MVSHRWQLVPLILLISGLLLIGLSAWFGGAAWSGWHIGLYAGCLLVSATAWWLRRPPPTRDEAFLRRQQQHLQHERAQLRRRQARLAAAQTAADKQIERYLTQLDRREQAVAHKLVTYHEWLEFPRPLDLSRKDLADDELAEFARKDRRMLELLAAESKRLFDNIRDNRYSHEGQFQIAPLRDDAQQLIQRVARIYQPDSEQPLLETSITHILRAASRACLHLLVVLDQLPLNVKEYNVNRMYGYVRQAVKAYGVYKSAEPYWPYFNSAFYLSRLAMGASPLSLGAWWFAQALSKRGAVALTTRIVNRQALLLLHNLVRVVGYEVASIYGGDFRHRDANWIYAAELTELVNRFPVSADSLSHALKEVSALQLRNEYDRVFLYRCLAAQASADPARYRPEACLTAEERQVIVERLERFHSHFLSEADAAMAAQWRKEVQQRLHVQLPPEPGQDVPPESQQRASAIRSLASFLLSAKDREPDELRELLEGTRLASALRTEQWAVLAEQLQQNPPFFFEHPDLPPGQPLVETFLTDLTQLAAQLTPRTPEIDELIADTAAYLRFNVAKATELLDNQYVSCLERLLPLDAPQRRLPPAAARAVLDLSATDRRPLFVYPDVQIESAGGAALRDVESLWLVGFEDRLVVFDAGGAASQHGRSSPLPRLVWQGDVSVRRTRVRRRLGVDVLLEGGQWLISGPAPDSSPAGYPVLRVPGALLGNSSAWFRALRPR